MALNIPQATESSVSLSDFKQWSRITKNQDDVLIRGLLLAAQNHAENFMNRLTVSRTVTQTLDSFESCSLGLAPFNSVSSVTYLDEDEVTQTLPASNYYTLVTGEAGTIYFQNELPTLLDRPQSITVTFTAGTDEVPEVIQTAIKLLAAHLYENREAVVVREGIVAVEVPFTIEALLLPYKNWNP